MSLSVKFANAPPDWREIELTFENEQDVRALIQKLGSEFLKRHVALHQELIRARWNLRSTP